MSEMIRRLAMVFFVVTSLTAMTSAATRHVAQVRIYLDKSGADKWVRVTGKSDKSDFRTEMESTFFEMNEILKTLEPNGVYLQMQIADIVFLNADILNTNNGKIVNNVSLAEFTNWMNGRNDRHDLAILYTGADLVTIDGSGDSYGYAYIGTVCQAKALGVIEIHATYMDVLATIHEIGHILGARHDGSKYAKSCKSNSGEIMNADTNKMSIKHFFFSSCSAYSIKNVINNLNGNNKNCLWSWDGSNDIKGPRFASLMTPDQICERTFGKTSYIARKAYNSYGDKVCVYLSCMTKSVGDRFFWTYVPTPQGLNCGKDKQCIQGRCVKTSSGSSYVSDICPFGDQPKIEGKFQTTCSQMNYKTCPTWKDTCCHTCPGTPDDVCKRFEGPASTMARRAYSSYGDALCQRLSCLDRVEGTYSYWNYHHDVPSNMQCGKGKICSDRICMHDAQFGDPNMSDSCPNGDQPWLAGDWQTTCPKQTKQHGCGGEGWAEMCCESCRDPGTADEICREREGQNSSMARRAYASYGDNLCSQLSCLTKVSGTYFNWRHRQAPNGMKCGRNKRCNNGKCEWTSTGDPNMSDACPYGDQPWLAGSWQKTCPDYVRQNGCPNENWGMICCSSCS